jgi:hypothetical protein
LANTDITREAYLVSFFCSGKAALILELELKREQPSEKACQGTVVVSQTR